MPIDLIEARDRVGNASIQVGFLEEDVAADATADAKASLKLARKELKEAKAAVTKMEKNGKVYGTVTQDLWMVIQNQLKEEFKVYISSYHGGDMEGNQCRQLMKEAKPIMAMVKAMLLEYLDELSVEDDLERRATVGEVDRFCRAFERLFQYFDVLSHKCYQPYGSLTDEDIADTKLCVNQMTNLWLKLMPTVPVKVHMWQHLLDDLEMHRGLKSHEESQIERAHQQGVKDRRRLGNLGCFQKKTKAGLKNLATAAKAEVVAMVENTEKSRKRKRSSPCTLNDEKKEERLEYLKLIVMLEPIQDEFPSLLELSKRHLQ